MVRLFGCTPIVKDYCQMHGTSSVRTKGKVVIRKILKLLPLVYIKRIPMIDKILLCICPLMVIEGITPEFFTLPKRMTIPNHS